MEVAVFKKPNASLNTEEKEAKKKLKRKLKFQSKVDRLERQIRHAISRKDPVVEKEASENLRKLLAQNDALLTDHEECDESKKKPHEVEEREGKMPLGSSSLNYKTAPDMSAARHFVLSICDDLFVRANEGCAQNQTEVTDQKSDIDREVYAENCKDSPQTVAQPSRKRKVTSTKAQQKTQAVKLLKHMTKGTQSDSMFRNQGALWGYTRQKFFERAMLLYRSLRRLGPDALPPDGCEGMTAEQTRMKAEVWTELLKVEKACSIGCGPGNDAVGLLTFLSVYRSNVGAGQSLPHVSLLDCFMEDWLPILTHLKSVLSGKDIVETWLTGSCDVTQPFDYCKISPAPSQHSNLKSESGATIAANSPVSRSNEQLPYDIFLFSYLLSETRGKWVAFMRALLRAAKPGCMFYFAEPVPWMLHRLIEISGDVLEFLWLDSSMHYPSMQALDGRVSPAVLFARKKKPPDKCKSG
uniref:Uncharacterized protein n=1 Tax=Odontella aurita TaxID=265563 RepID=A0A7S4MVF1_9STRA